MTNSVAVCILRNTHQKAMLSIFIGKWVLANQRRGRWLSLVQKRIRPIRIAKDVFSGGGKMLRPIRSHRGVWVSRQNFRLFLQVAATLPTNSTRKVFLEGFFLSKSEKKFGNWCGMVSFVSLSLKKNVESGRNNSGRRKTEQDVSLCCAFYRSYFVFHLRLSLRF